MEKSWEMMVSWDFHGLLNDFYRILMGFYGVLWDLPSGKHDFHQLAVWINLPDGQGPTIDIDIIIVNSGTKIFS